ncbi:AEC family transporter [Rhodobacteraceae bacterium 2376]|uniref:AEC family transporter n=1 Tax=Rhabdonatronobacter sediminivivens TaxID=2743469 RepID=A0A7Z0HZQ3_9RHOB|nr:AEC family transporter [Rhabdonatronobacter sediminivivens]NYS25248.1 AEC family transporter [Rhabdonatronobacter sediminivivens]
MVEIFLKTLPFFAVIGLGFGAGRAGAFGPEATAWLTKFVFYFALSAMLFGFAANLSLGDLFQMRAFSAYLWACLVLYALVMGVAFLRRRPLSEATIEAHTATIGNTGFLGVPMLVVLLGPESVPAVLMILTIDLIVFSSLFTMLITFAREGRISPELPGILLRAVGKNPMVMSMALGLLWSASGVPLPGTINDFMVLLGAAATPCALFAIGASLADKRAERLGIVSWLCFGKLVLHPALVALATLVIFRVDPVTAGVMIAASALPVAGNVFILAQQYQVGPARVSAAILISTVISIATIPVIIAWVSGF